MSIDLRPVSIEFFADTFYKLDITFVTNEKEYSENTQTVPGILVSVFEKCKNPFTFILKLPNNEIVESFNVNYIPTISYIKQQYGCGSYVCEISHSKTSIENGCDFYVCDISHSKTSIEACFTI